MKGELDPDVVLARLDALRASFVAETVDEARARLAREAPSADESFEEGVARRLAELRALHELARALHRRRST